jgi:hypothetical protein
MRLSALCLALFGGLAGCSTADLPAQEKGFAATRLLSPAVRRLSAAELSAAASSLVGAEVELSSTLPPDARQHDFSRSLTQSVDALTLSRLYDAGAKAAELLDVRSLPACTTNAQATDAPCRASVVSTLAERAFRRAATAEELAGLTSLFELGAADARFQDGAALVVRALLGSPHLLYDTALGASSASPGTYSLSDDELASQLGWLMSGAPPDVELRRAAADGSLRSGHERRQQAQRLLQAPSSRPVYRRLVEEWLGLSRLRSLAKSSAVLADFATLRESMLRETQAVVDDAFASSGGSLRLLFAGGYSFVPPELSPLYGIAAPANDERVGLGKLGRIGLMQHASFLATYAHEDGSAPVLRGKAVLERLLCRKMPSPAELGIDLMLPAPDAAATTRERFARHASAPMCRACHDDLDGIGFVFEHFDAAGRYRSSEAGRAIDSSGQVTLDGERLALTDSAELARLLAGSEELAVCAARHVVRFAAGTEATEVEDEFVSATRSLAPEERGTLAGLLLAYVQGDWFARRQTP